VDTAGSSVDGLRTADSHRWWTRRGQVVENVGTRWKHADVIRRAGDDDAVRPHTVHATETQLDLQEQPIIHTVHTPTGTATNTGILLFFSE
jgi:hypothetical protein